MTNDLVSTVFYADPYFHGIATLARALDRHQSLSDADVRDILRCALPPSVVALAEPDYAPQEPPPSHEALIAAIVAIGAYVVPQSDTAVTVGADHRCMVADEVALHVRESRWGVRSPYPPLSPPPAHQSSRPLEPLPGWLYALGHGDLVKLGRSGTPVARTRALNATLARRGKILALIRESVVSERQAHERWAAIRVTGEWFQATPELMEWVSSLGIDPDAP